MMPTLTVPTPNPLPSPPIWWPRELPLVRCDLNLSMGMDIGNMKFVNSDGAVIIKADGGGDTVNFMFESPSK